LILTFAATGSRLSTKVVMPALKQRLLMLMNQAPDAPQFMFWETPVLGQAQPVLAKTWRFADRASRDYAAAHLHLN
jgi:hypothetical protein